MSTIDRRKFLTRTGGTAAVAGVAWVAPSILGTSVAWASGTCPDTGIQPFPTTAPTTNSNGWNRTITAGTFEPTNPFTGTHGYLGIKPNYNGIQPAFVCENDPTALAGGVATVTYATTFAATAGQTYQFTFSSFSVTANPVPQYFRLIVDNQVLMQGNTDGGSGGGKSFTGAQTWTAPNVLAYAPATSGTKTFVFEFSLKTARTSGSTAGDDIGVSQPTVICSPTPPV